MTGYGRGESIRAGRKFTVEINSVNRKQTDILVSLPKELADLENRVRDLVNTAVARGRLNVVVDVAEGRTAAPRIDLDLPLARGYRDALRTLKEELGLEGEVDLETIVRSPGVLRISEQDVTAEDAWPAVEEATQDALKELVTMRGREGKHLAKELIRLLKEIRASLKTIRALHPRVVTRYAEALRERIASAGLDIAIDDERLRKEIVVFADRADVTEELARLDSHMNQFAHHLRAQEPVGRTLDFLTQEIFRELNTLGSKANDAEISQLVVTCKAGMERIREQVQNIE